MATVQEVINYARSLADQGIGADADGAYGTQCVDLPNSISQIYFGKILWGNAIDLLDSAAALGYEVVYDAVGVNPRAGAIFVMAVAEHGYGHTGLVIEDSDGYTNVRALGSSKAKIITQVKSGSFVDVIEKRGDWWKVKTDNGIVGYIHKSRIIPR